MLLRWAVSPSFTLSIETTAFLMEPEEVLFFGAMIATDSLRTTPPDRQPLVQKE
jgi:hypothetical protein